MPSVCVQQDAHPWFSVIARALTLVARLAPAHPASAVQEAVSKPSTVAAFKNHPTFVLERHIGKYQAIVPWAKKAGLHK